MRAKNLRSLVSQGHRLFNTRSPSMQPFMRQFSQNKAQHDSKIPFINYLSGAGLFGGILATMYLSGSIPLNEDVMGQASSTTAKDPNNPARSVWHVSEVLPGGIGDGGEGRSCPTEGCIVHMGTRIRGYHKNPANGRRGLLNELVYHEFAQKVVPGHHPRIKLIESPCTDTTSSYQLFIESIGDNLNLLQYCRLLAENVETLDSGSLEHLGCSLAFAALILSADNFMKNFVVVSKTQRHGAVYPIDFEVLDRSKDRHHEIDYIDLNISPSDAIKSFLAHGGLLDYKERFSWNERFREQSGAEDTSDIGKGWTTFGRASRLVHQFIVKHAAQDITNGDILTMYKNIAALDEYDIDHMLNQYDFLITEKERDSYKHDILAIVQDTQKFVSKFDQSRNQKP